MENGKTRSSLLFRCIEVKFPVSFIAKILNAGITNVVKKTINTIIH